MSIEADAEMQFLKWEVVAGDVALQDAFARSTTFIMPMSAVEIRAVAAVPIAALRLIDRRTMLCGEEILLRPELEPAGASAQYLTWASDDPAVATVDQSGLVRATGAGTARITVTDRLNEALSATCTITVEAAEPDAPTPLPPAQLTLGRDAKLSLGNLTNLTITWTSDNPTVATVNARGDIRARAPGKALVTGEVGAGPGKSIMVGDRVVIEVEVVKRGAAVTGMSLSPRALNLNRGESQLLSARTAPAQAVDGRVYWHTSDHRVAVVDDRGAVTGIGEGTATITATASSGIRRTATVRVSGDAAPVAPPDATAIALSVGERTQAVGERTYLTVLPTPANADLTGLVWSSDNPEIATVDSETGMIVGVSAGDTTITAALGALRATCALTVTEAGENMESVVLNADLLALERGKALKLKNLTGYSGTWTSSDPKLARIQGGRLRVNKKKLGDVTLTFTVGTVVEKGAQFMGKSLVVGDRVDVTLHIVGKGLAAKGVTPAFPAFIAVGEQARIEATVTPKKAAYKQVFFRSENPSVVRVDSKGVMTGVKPGKAKLILVTTSGKAKSITVTVSEQIEKLTLNRAKLTIKRGETFALSLKAHLPAGLPAPRIAWNSGKKAVATVDENGLVTALKKGKTTITATASNGVTVKCRITVK